MFDCYWSLFNYRDQSRFDGLRTAQARVLVSSIPADQIEVWFAWKEGTAEWLPLEHFTELFQQVSEDTQMETKSIYLAPAVTETAIPQRVERQEEVSHVTDALLADDDDMGDDMDEGGATNVVRTEGGGLSAANGTVTATDTDTADTDLTFGEFSVLDFDGGELPDLGEKRTPVPPPPIPARWPKPKNPPAMGSPASGERPSPDQVAVFTLEEAAMDKVKVELEKQPHHVDRRKVNRYRKRIAVTIDWGGLSVFKTYTEELSLGGMRLENPLPEGIHPVFKTILTCGTERLETVCVPVRKLHETECFTIKFLSVNRMDLLRTWILTLGR